MMLARMIQPSGAQTFETKGSLPKVLRATRAAEMLDPGRIFRVAHAAIPLSPALLGATLLVVAALTRLETMGSPDALTGLFIVGATAILILEKLRSITATNDRRSPSDAAPAEGARELWGADELAAAIVHEVNQPLSAMTVHGQACLRWFDRDVPDIEAARRSVERMLASGSRAAGIIAGLTELARGSAPDRAPTDVNDVLHSALSRVADDIEALHIEVRLELGDAGLRVHAGQVELEQVIVNLVTNAVQALSRIEGPRQLTLVSRASPLQRFIVVEVRDNGPGFASDACPHLFDPFFTTKAQGMGMGLAISHAIVSSLGGRLDARMNDHGGGACFSLQLNQLQAEGRVR